MFKVNVTYTGLPTVTARKAGTFPLSHSILEPTREPTLKTYSVGFPGGAVVENLPANAGDMGSRPGLGRSHMP